MSVFSVPFNLMANLMALFLYLKKHNKINANRRTLLPPFPLLAQAFVLISKKCHKVCHKVNDKLDTFSFIHVLLITAHPIDIEYAEITLSCSSS